MKNTCLAVFLVKGSRHEKKKLRTILCLVFNVLFFAYIYGLSNHDEIRLTNLVSLKVPYKLQERMIQLVIDG